MLIFCFLLFLVDYCDAFVNEYLNTSSIGSQMQKYVASFNSLNLTDISSFSQYIGKSTNGRLITAYCFGRCDLSFPSVICYSLQMIHSC